MTQVFSIKKLRGQVEKCPQRLPLWMIAIAWIGGTIATAALALIEDWQDVVMIVGSFGASCLLIFAYPTSPFAQPRNIVGGHCIATMTGLVFLYVFGLHWWSMATAASTAIALMLLLRVPHPPAASNPLIVMLAGAKWSFLFTPTLTGSVALVMVALVYNNVGIGRQYPTYW